VSNFVIRQEGPSSVVADNIWEVRLGAGSLLLGALTGAFVALYLRSRDEPGATAARPEGWSPNIAHRGGAGIAPENTLVGFRKGLEVGAGVLELDVHASADGHVVVIHDETVDRTTDGRGPVREKTLPEIKKLDAGYDFPPDGGESYPYRDRGVTVPTLEEVYREFPNVPTNVEIKGTRPGIEKAVLRVIEDAGAEDRTLVVSEKDATIRRFREVSGGRVATGSSSKEIAVFYLLSHLRLSGLLRPPYQALQGPAWKVLRVVTPTFVRAAHELGVRVDVWTINKEPDMRRLLGFGVDGIMTDRPDVLARVLEGSTLGVPSIKS
jgi:glycerophosphoryl diester phosphodiesterase